MEIWKNIIEEDIQDIYSISNLGRVKNNESGYIYISKSKKHNDYIRVHLKRKSKKTRKNFLIHRLVAKYFIENPNNYPVVNHIDENRQNNCITNLEWCTQQINMKKWRDNLKNSKKGA